VASWSEVVQSPPGQKKEKKMARSVLPLAPRAMRVVRPPLNRAVWGWSNHPRGLWEWFGHPKGKTEKKRNFEGLALGMAELPPIAKTDLDLYFYFVWFGHPRLAKGVGCVFIFFNFIIF
jgi:hypothetical protein